MSFQDFYNGKITLDLIEKNAIKWVLKTVLDDIDKALRDYPNDEKLLELRQEVLTKVVMMDRIKNKVRLRFGIRRA